SGNLDVVVPPDILNEHEPNTLEGGVVNEAGNVQLVCQATGVPEPTVQWRRENGKDIVVRTEGREKQVVKLVEGERHGRLSLHCLERGSALRMKLYEGEKYTISEEKLKAYTWQLNLTVKNLHKGDFGPYICSSINALGKSDARIRLQELHLPPKPTTTPTPYVPSTVKQPRRKQHSHGKGGNSFNRDTYVRNHIQENDYLGSLSVHEDVLEGRGTVQVAITVVELLKYHNPTANVRSPTRNLYGTGSSFSSGGSTGSSSNGAGVPKSSPSSSSLSSSVSGNGT
uniref:Uncharacterized protein n=1 Tax=Anopheles atroparvus TaxID=41427 RepID=A0A182J5M1_ANOAO